MLVVLALLARPVRTQIMVVSDKDGQNMRFVDTSADPWYVTTPSTTPASLKITKPVGAGLTPDAMRVIISDVATCQLKSVDLSVSPYVLSVVAGTGTCPGNAVDLQVDGIGSAAVLNQPQGLAVSADGSFALWVEYKGKWVRRVDLRTNEVKSIVEAGTQKDLNSAYGIAISADDSFALIGDTENHVVRKMDLTTLTSVVAAGEVGRQGEGDGLPATSRMRFPCGVAIAPDMSYGIVADRNNELIKKLVFESDGTFTLSTLVADTWKQPYFCDFSADGSGIFWTIQQGGAAILIAKADGTSIWLKAGAQDGRGAVDGEGADARFNKPMQIAWKSPKILPATAFSVSGITGCAAPASWASTMGCAVEGGTTITLTGVGYRYTGATSLAVSFNGEPCTLVTDNAAQCAAAPNSAEYTLRCKLPCASAAMRGKTYPPVVTRTLNGATETAKVNFLATITYAAATDPAATFSCFLPPAVSGVSPAIVFQGTNIVVSGANFGPASRGALAMSVMVGTFDCTANVDAGSWTELTFTVANCATSGAALPVTVTVGSLASAPSAATIAVVDTTTLVPTAASITAVDWAAATLTVGWGTPSTVPGTLLKFVVEYCTSIAFAPSASVTSVDAANAASSATLTGLTLGTVYYARVGAVHSHAPTAPIYATALVNRLAAAPSVPSVIGVDASTVLATDTTTSAIIRWRLPFTLNGAVPSGCTIKWVEGANEVSIFIKLDPSDTSTTMRLATATDLELGKTYIFTAKLHATIEQGSVNARVTAAVDSGFGAAAGNGATLALVPLDRPGTVSSTVINEYDDGVWYNASVTFDPPPQPAASAVVRYVMYHRVGGTGTWTSRACTLTDPTTLLKCGAYGGLPAATIVCFRAAAVYTTGESTQTESSCILPFYIAPTPSPVANYVAPTPHPSALTPSKVGAFYSGIHVGGLLYSGYFVWDATDGATMYSIVEKRTATDTTSTTSTIAVSGPGVGATGSIVHKVENIPLTTTVCATVQSDSAGGVGTVSAEYCMRTSAPMAPTELTGVFENGNDILGNLDGSVKLALGWSAPDQSSTATPEVGRSAVTSYLVKYASLPSLPLVDVDTASRESKYVISFSSLEDNLEFQVAAVSALGTSTFSAKKLLAISAPSAPTQLSGTFESPDAAKGTVRVTIRWAAPDQSPTPGIGRTAVTAYKIKYEGISTATEGANAVPSVPLVEITTSTAAPLHVIEFKVLNNDVEFQVAAVTALGTSAYSNKVKLDWPFADQLKGKCAQLGQYLPQGRADCLKCPDVGVSCLSGILVVEQGFWFRTGGGIMISDTSKAYACLNRAACVPDTNGNSDVACAPGYGGVACAVCSPGYVPSGTFCTVAYDVAVGVALFGVEFVATLAIAVIAMFAHTTAIPAVRIAMDFVQVACIMLGASTFRNLKTGQAVARGVRVIAGPDLPSSIALGSFVPSVASSIHDRHYMSFGLMFGAVLVPLLIALKISCVHHTHTFLKELHGAVGDQLAADEEAMRAETESDPYRSRGRTEAEGSESDSDGSSVEDDGTVNEDDGEDEIPSSFASRTLSNFLRLSVPMAYFMHTELVRSSIAPLIVVDRDETNVMLYSPSELADSPKHIISLIMSCFTLVVFGVCVPGAMLIVVVHGLTEKPAYSSRCSIGCSFVHVGLRSKTRWWQLFVMLRRAALTMIVVVDDDAPIVQSIMCCAVCITSLMMHALMKPYKTLVANALAVLCELAVLVVPFAGLVFWTRDSGAHKLLPSITVEFEKEISSWLIVLLALVMVAVLAIASIRCVLSTKKAHTLYESVHKHVAHLLHLHVVSRVHNASKAVVTADSATDGARVGTAVEMMDLDNSAGSTNPLFARRGRVPSATKEQSESPGSEFSSSRGNPMHQAYQGANAHAAHTLRAAERKRSVQRRHTASAPSASEEDFDADDVGNDVHEWQRPQAISTGRASPLSAGSAMSPHYFPQNVTPQISPQHARSPMSSDSVASPHYFPQQPHAAPMFVAHDAPAEEILHPATVKRRRASIAEFEAAFASMTGGDDAGDAGGVGDLIDGTESDDELDVDFDI